MTSTKPKKPSLTVPPERAKHNLSVALDYAEIGVPVFPCNDRSPQRGGGSLVKWGKGVDGHPNLKMRKATTDPDTIKAWWRRWPFAVPGFPTGRTSGLAVLDLDRKDGKDGVEAIRTWGFDPHTSPATVVDTPSGGVHLFFKHRPGLRS
ncbi:MAG: bifunctional DNA primase/polymerase, partial [Maricaulaceae bacterium]